jgi:hypothetical protein
MYHSLSIKIILFCFAFPCEPWLLFQMSLMLGDDTCNVLQRVNGVLDSLNTGTATPDQVNSVLDNIRNTLINAASVVFVQKKKKIRKIRYM